MNWNLIYLWTIGGICALIVIVSLTKKNRQDSGWIYVIIFGVFAIMAIGGALTKPSYDRQVARKDADAGREIVARYPEIRRIIDLDRGMKTIKYLDQNSRKCSTTMVHRDHRWLVNTQTADCK